MSVKIAALVKEEIQIDELQEMYYTDSEITLGYLGNNVKRFRTFVANRRQIILTYTNFDSWRHVISVDNPADLASRGISMNETDKIKLWMHGPEFLKTPTGMLQVSPPVIEVDDSDPEIIRSACVAATTESNKVCLLSHFEKRFSKWGRWIRVLVYVLRAIEYFKEKQGKIRKSRSSELLPKDLSFMRMSEVEKAEKTLIKLIQERSYAVEIKMYRNTANKKKRIKNRLWRLDRLLRVLVR